MDNDRSNSLEDRLRTAGRNLAYPPAPEIPVPDPGPGLKPRARRAVFAAAAALLLVFTLAAVPPVRAAVLAFIQVGAVRIFGDPADLPDAETIPASVPELAHIFGRTTLTDAASQIDFPIEFPSALGPPDAVYVQRRGGELVFLVWLSGDEVGESLTILGPGAFAWKAPFEPADEVRFGETGAFWIEGPHPFFLRSESGGDVEVLLFDAGSVLIWEDGPLTYRLEGQFNFEEAVRIAESIGDDES